MATNGFNFEAAMRLRYPVKEYALFFELRNATGFKGNRSADAFCMSTWPSRGLTCHGFERKTYRSDWLREKKNPDKQEQGLIKYCDHWWVVADEKNVVTEEELHGIPWGLMVGHGQQLRIVKQAPELKPIPFDKSFIAVLLRSATEKVIYKSEIAAQLQAEYQRGSDAKASHAQYSDGLYRKQCEMVKKASQEIGFNVTDLEYSWQREHIRKALEIAKNGLDFNYHEKIQTLLREAEHFRQTILSVQQLAKEFDADRRFEQGDGI